jgi:hypothetical protein
MITIQSFLRRREASIIEVFAGFRLSASLRPE